MKTEQERNIPGEEKYFYHFRIVERNTKWFIKLRKCKYIVVVEREMLRDVMKERLEGNGFIG
jgi:hypothetical protein